MARDRQPDLKLATVRGIEIRINWSLAFVFFLIAFSLAFNLGVVFPVHHPDWSLALSWTVALLAATLFFVSVLAHELSHALVGLRKINALFSSRDTVLLGS